MTVSELITELCNCPLDLEVFDFTGSEVVDVYIRGNSVELVTEEWK